MRPNQVMFIYKSQLKDVKSRKETTLQISARNTNSRKIAANKKSKIAETPMNTGFMRHSQLCLWFLPCKRPAAER